MLTDDVFPVCRLLACSLIYILVYASEYFTKYKIFVYYDVHIWCCFSFSLTWSVTHRYSLVYTLAYTSGSSQKILQNISMLNMFTFDVFSVLHSLGQSPPVHRRICLHFVKNNAGSNHVSFSNQKDTKGRSGERGTFFSNMKSSKRKVHVVHEI